MQVMGTAATAPLGLKRAAHGGLEPFGGDGGKVVVAGDIVTVHGDSFYMPYVQLRAVEAWEKLFRQFGVSE